MTHRLHGAPSMFPTSTGHLAEDVRALQSLAILDTLVGCSAISAVRVGGKWAVRVDGAPEHFGDDLADALGQACTVILLNRESGE